MEMFFAQDVANTYDYPAAVPEHDRLSEINNDHDVCGAGSGEAPSVQTGSDTGKHYTLLNGKLDVRISVMLTWGRCSQNCLQHYSITIPGKLIQADTQRLKKSF